MRDLQTVPAAPFDFFFFLLLFSLVQLWVYIYIYIYIYILASVSLGTKKNKKKTAPSDRYGPTNSVKNIEWWKLGDDAKHV